MKKRIGDRAPFFFTYGTDFRMLLIKHKLSLESGLSMKKSLFLSDSLYSTRSDQDFARYRDDSFRQTDLQHIGNIPENMVKPADPCAAFLLNSTFRQPIPGFFFGKVG